ncbi:DUF11 domain-containing protein [Candidatus Sumerlaeota bacterium]|nr:DUF11 domain-containing protein [Candidatus Sumerlaeota bacterium]
MAPTPSTDAAMILDGDTVTPQWIFGEPQGCTDLTIESGGTLLMMDGFLNLCGTALVNSGEFTMGPSSSLGFVNTFNGRVTSSSHISFEAVIVDQSSVEFMDSCTFRDLDFNSGVIDFGSSSEITGWMWMRSGDCSVTGAPHWGPESELRYPPDFHGNTSSEWLSGAPGSRGVPQDVRLWCNNAVTLEAGVAHSVAGDLTLTVTGIGCTLNGNGEPLEVGGDLIYDDQSSSQPAEPAIFNPHGSTLVFNGEGTSVLHQFVPELELSGVTVTSGTTLVVEGDPSAYGTVTNQGVIRDHGTVGGAVEVYDLIPGLVIEVTTQGSLSSFEVEWVGTDHPSMEAEDQSGQHWSITPDDGTGTVVILTLPHDGLTDPHIYHHLGGTEWEWGRDTFDTDSITWTGITDIAGDWLVGDGPGTDLTITKEDSADPAVPSGELIYTITVTNEGPQTATGIVVSDELPAGVTFQSVTVSQGIASEEAGVVTAALGALAGGAMASVEVIVSVDVETEGLITNWAEVAAGVIEPTDNNVASEETMVGVTTGQMVDSLLGLQDPELPLEILDVNEDNHFDAADVTTLVNESGSP